MSGLILSNLDSLHELMCVYRLNVATTAKEIDHYNDDGGGDADDDGEKDVYLLNNNRDAMRPSIEVTFIKIDII